MYADNSFDFVHIRQLTGFIGDWPKLYAQALRVLKPGGYFEAQDILGIGCDDSSVPKDSTLFRWFNLWIEAVRKAGMEAVGSHKEALIGAGFDDVVYRLIKIPIGTWAKEVSGKEIGVYMRQQLIEGGESISLALMTRFLGWTKQEVDLLLAAFRRDLRMGRYHGYGLLHTTYGRKPEKKGEEEAAVEAVEEKIG